MRILVIEDDLDLANLLKKSLAEESYIVDSEHDGIRGSYTARTNPYNLYIIDYGLPGKRGDQVCEEIRLAGINSPILIVSVEAEVDDKVHLLKCGADDYLSKPFAFSELAARIQSLLRRPYVIHSPVFTLDDLTIDTEKKTVCKKGRDIYLTRKEYLLLECMARKQGNIVSRAEIMDEAWSKESNPFSNTVEAHIRNLRKKLERNSKQKYIHTVPGRGYKLDMRK